MNKLFHKIYLVTQAIILSLGLLLTIWVLYQAFTLESDEYISARSCAMQAISKDMPLSVTNKYSTQWTKLVSASLLEKSEIKAMVAEADRITNLCSNKHFVATVSEDTGEIGLFIVKDNIYKPAQDFELFLILLGVVIGGSAILSLLLFILRKWIGIVFK